MLDLIAILTLIGIAYTYNAIEQYSRLGYFKWDPFYKP